VHYSIVRELSHPASPHEVMLARDAADDGVVLKRLRASHRERDDLALRLELEATVLGELGGQRGVVRLAGLERSPLTIVMEYVSGGSLAGRARDVLDRQIGMPLARVLDVSGGILEALGYLHANDVVHRDVKPSNILFDGDGTVRLIDFGVAARADPGRGGLLYGLPPDWIEERVGTLPYAAPETVREPAGPATPAQDVYGAAVVVFEMLAGAPPWNLTPGERPESFVERLECEWEDNGLPDIPGVDPRVVQALSLALHPDPRRRLGSARELATRLGLS
jgi:eukaryotic-like serine/threonine-protein kinase